MKKLRIEELENTNGGGFCAKAGGLLGGAGLGVAGLTYFGVITVATGGTAGLVLAVASAGVALYCEAPRLAQPSIR